MSKPRKVDVYYSLQSAYCYFLTDRLLALNRAGVTVTIRPILGLVLRIPGAMADRSPRELAYFDTDTHRTAAYLDLPFANPDPSPIAFKPGQWVAEDHQPLIDRLFRLFVGSERAGCGLGFLDIIARGLWDGSQPGWDQSGFLERGMAQIGLDHDAVLAKTPWDGVEAELEANHHAMLAAGHWGAPLMVYGGEPFYGQDRFDQLLWRMGLTLD